MGDDAVDPLSKYIDSEHKGGLSELIAVRPLIAIGGRITEAPLQPCSQCDRRE